MARSCSGSASRGRKDEKMEREKQEDKMRELYEALQQVEVDRAAGKPGCTLDELEEYLDDILEE